MSRFAGRLAALVVAASVVHPGLATPVSGRTTSAFDATSAGTSQSQQHASVAARRVTLAEVPDVADLAGEANGGTTGPAGVAPATLAGPGGVRSGGVLPTSKSVLASGSGAPRAIARTFVGLTAAEAAAVYAACAGDPLCVEPADPWIATGPDHVVQSAGGLVRVTRRDGTVLRTIGQAAFFGLPDEEIVYQARVLHDARTGRWLATQASYRCAGDPTGYVDVSISTSGDPTGTWTVYGFAHPGSLPVSPAIGTSADKVLVGHGEYDLAAVCDGAGEASADYLGGRLVAIDWDDLVAAPPQVIAAFSDRDASLRAWRPATATPATAGATTAHAIVAIDTGGSALDIGYRAVTGRNAPVEGIVFHPLVNLTSLLGLAPFREPPAPGQPGTPPTIAEAADLLPTDAVVRAGRLVFVATTGCRPTGDSADRSCVRVTELATPATAAGTPTLTQELLVGTAGADSFVGGVALAGDGALHVAWTRSSPTTGASTYAAYQRPTDPPGSLSAELLVGSGGTATYGGSRWGTHLGVAADPADPAAVWIGAPHTAANGSWATTVAQVQGPIEGTAYRPLTPVRLLDTRTGNGLSGPFAVDLPRAFQVAGRGGIPADAVAVTGNLTVTGQTGPGFVALTPVETATPRTSTLNVPVGDNRANNVTIRLGPGGTLAAVWKAPAGSTTQLVFDATGYFAADPGGLTYRSLGPVRLLDTRTGNGLAGAFAANQPRILAVTGRGGVPAGALAVSGNLTVVGQTRAGYVSLTPARTTTPATSTLNFPAGDIRANGVVVPLGPDGTLAAVYKAPAGSTTHLVLDVTGYFAADPSGARWVPLDPVRVLDSRTGTGLAGAFTASVPRTLGLAGVAGVALDAVAVSANLTVTGQAAAGYASVTVVPTATPSTSTLNVPLGDDRANGLVAPLSGTGTVSLVYKAPTGRTAHLVLDLTGYFR